jgi:lysyl-tRNA synthetase class 2
MPKLSKPQLLIERAGLLSQVRQFFQKRSVLEVDTPLVDSHTVTDPYMSALQVFNLQEPYFQDGRSQEERSQKSHFPEKSTQEKNIQQKRVGYLQTSPEYAMKRLLAEGSGDIYQLGKMFRADESGQYHSPEFTMLEWYRVGFGLEQLIQEVYELVCEIIGRRPLEHYTYHQAFLKWTELDPLTDSTETIKQFAEKILGDIPNNLLRDNYLSLLFSEVIEKQFNLNAITVISHYPESQASLAKLVEVDGFKLGERFEVYTGGLELANGFHELTDAKEQLQRFQQDNRIRRRLGVKPVDIDYRLIDALEKGLPDCSGVALGFDRLLMIKLQQSHIRDVLA